VLAFVTSLRHPLNSADYDEVERLLAETLTSVCNQEAGSDFAVFVVGNQRPAFALPPAVTFVPVDFPPPVDSAGPQFGREPFVWDKGTKIGIGLAAARAVRPDHVMVFDADDYVHRGIAALAASDPTAPGWYVDEGFIYSRRRQSYRVIPQFSGRCGTCHVLRWDLYGVPPDLTTTASQEEVAKAFGERLPALLGAHRGLRSWLGERGVPLDPMPFRGAVYQVDTGENHSGTELHGMARPVGRSLARDFGLPRPPLLPAAARGLLAPREVEHEVRRRLRRLKSRFSSGAP
jgi:hypothetical protein